MHVVIDGEAGYAELAGYFSDRNLSRDELFKKIDVYLVVGASRTPYVPALAARRGGIHVARQRVMLRKLLLLVRLLPG